MIQPWMRSWMLKQKEELATLERKPKCPHSTMMTVWLMVLIAAVGAIVMDMFRPEPPAVEMTAGVNKAAVMARQWDGTSDLGWWSARELFILRESKPGTSARHLDAIYMAERR